MESSPITRYRCNACGNLTRFEVTVTRRTRAFHHFTIGGDLSIEDTQVLAEEIEPVVCRWCDSSASVVVIADDELAAVLASDDAPPAEA